MKAIFAALSVIACAAAAMPAAAASKYCVSFAPAGFCDGMEFDGVKSATWHNYDCAGSTGKQTTAKATKKAATTTCDGSKGCNPAAAYGWDSLDWSFNGTDDTGTLTGTTGGQTFVLQQDIPVSVTAGACAFSEGKGGTSSLAR